MLDDKNVVRTGTGQAYRIFADMARAWHQIHAVITGDVYGRIRRTPYSRPVMMMRVSLCTHGITTYLLRCTGMTCHAPYEAT